MFELLPGGSNGELHKNTIDILHSLPLRGAPAPPCLDWLETSPLVPIAVMVLF